MNHIEIVFAISLELMAYVFGAVLMAAVGYELLIRRIRRRTVVNPEGVAFIVAAVLCVALALKVIVVSIKTGAI